MRHPATNKHIDSSASSVNAWPFQTPPMGDSLEVMEDYHREKVQVLERTLQNLNLLENAREITFLCREVILVKAALDRICQRRQFLA